MFKYTRAIFAKMLREFNAIAFGIAIISAILTAFIPVYNIVTDENIGIVIVNIVLLALVVASLVVTIVSYVNSYNARGKKLKKVKKEKKKAEKIIRVIKILANSAKLGITIYGICAVATNVTPLSLVMVIFSGLMLVFSITAELVEAFFTNRFELIVDAFEADIEPFIKVRNTTTDIVNFFTGKRPEEREELISDKNRKILEEELELQKQIKLADKEEEKQDNAKYREEKRAERKVKKEEAIKKKQLKKEAKSDEKIKKKSFRNVVTYK